MKRQTSGRGRCRQCAGLRPLPRSVRRRRPWEVSCVGQLDRRDVADCKYVVVVCLQRSRRRRCGVARVGIRSGHTHRRTRCGRHDPQGPRSARAQRLGDQRPRPRRGRAGQGARGGARNVLGGDGRRLRRALRRAGGPARHGRRRFAGRRGDDRPESRKRGPGPPPLGASPRQKDLFIEVDFSRRSKEDNTRKVDKKLPANMARDFAAAYGDTTTSQTSRSRHAATLRNPGGRRDQRASRHGRSPVRAERRDDLRGLGRSQRRRRGQGGRRVERRRISRRVEEGDERGETRFLPPRARVCDRRRPDEGGAIRGTRSFCSLGSVVHTVNAVRVPWTSTLVSFGCVLLQLVATTIGAICCTFCPTQFASAQVLGVPTPRSRPMRSRRAGSRRANTMKHGVGVQPARRRFWRLRGRGSPRRCRCRGGPCSGRSPDRS